MAGTSIQCPMFIFNFDVLIKHNLSAPNVLKLIYNFSLAVSRKDDARKIFPSFVQTCLQDGGHQK